MTRRALFLPCIALLFTSAVQAQVSAYTFTQEVGNWQPLGGAGSLLGMPGMPPAFNNYDDNSFVTQGESILLGYSSSGNGWPIGFTFHYNGHAYDRVGLSIEGWLAFGSSSDGNSAVLVPIGATAYTPLSSALPEGADPLKRNRIAGFAADLAAQGAGGLWPIQLMTQGTAPNRRFIAEWNVVRSGGSVPLSFQIRLNEGGAIPAQQTVQVIFGNMVHSAAINGQVGLGGTSPADYNNRTVATSPYDWVQSVAGTDNTATCRPPSNATYLPQGLTFTWTPPGCTVTGIAVTDLANSGGMINGSLSWSALPSATSYSYTITTGGPDDPALLSGAGLTDTTAMLSDLPVGMDLFAYVAADCGDGMQGWGAGLPFSTANLVEVICGEAPQQFTHCYANLEQTTWHYQSSTGDPLRMIIQAGTITNGDLLTIHDGATEQAPVLFSSANGSIAGQIINSSGPHLTMRLISDDIGSCATQDFIPAMEWEVGCVDCDPVYATFQNVDDCANGQFSVNVQVFSMGSASTLIIGSDADNTTITAIATGLYTMGPFPTGTPVVITAANPDNAYCSAVSLPLLNLPCPTVGCGPETYTYCYENNDNSQWAYQSTNGERIGIRFTAGTLANGDVIRIYDGLDPMMSAPLFSGSQGGNLIGLMRATSAANPDHAFLLEVESNSTGSCASGQAGPWEYIVACYDGCTQPAATFSTVPNCAEGNFSIAVEIASLGSAASVDIVSNAGTSTLNVTAPGTYSIGPFPVGQQVVAEVQGANVLCTVNSDALSENCQVGIGENATNAMHIFPNPSDGTFRLVLPMGFGGQGRLEVLDITGHSVARRMLRGLSGLGVDCDLGYLPAGRYVLVLDDGQQRVHAPISIMPH